MEEHNSIATIQYAFCCRLWRHISFKPDVQCFLLHSYRCALRNHFCDVQSQACGKTAHHKALRGSIAVPSAEERCTLEIQDLPLFLPQGQLPKHPLRQTLHFALTSSRRDGRPPGRLELQTLPDQMGRFSFVFLLPTQGPKQLLVALGHELPAIRFIILSSIGHQLRRFSGC